MKDSKSPLLADQNEKTTKHCSATFLKVLLCVVVVGGLILMTYKLLTYYHHASPTCKVVTGQHFHQEGDANTTTKRTEPMCDLGDDTQRFDCHPGPGASQVSLLTIHV